MQDVTAARQSLVQGSRGQVSGMPASVEFNFAAKPQQEPQASQAGLDGSHAPHLLGTVPSIVDAPDSGSRSQVCQAAECQCRHSKKVEMLLNMPQTLPSCFNYIACNTSTAARDQIHHQPFQMHAGAEHTEGHAHLWDGPGNANYGPSGGSTCGAINKCSIPGTCTLHFPVLLVRGTGHLCSGRQLA